MEVDPLALAVFGRKNKTLFSFWKFLCTQNLGGLLGYFVVVSTLDWQIEDLGSFPSSCTSGGDKLFKQAPLAGSCKPATWLLKS